MWLISVFNTATVTVTAIATATATTIFVISLTSANCRKYR